MRTRYGSVCILLIVLLLTILLLETVLAMLLCSSIMFLLGHKNSVLKSSFKPTRAIMKVTICRCYSVFVLSTNMCTYICCKKVDNHLLLHI